MARTHQAYPPEIRERMVELVQSGRTPQELAREYEPSAGSIRNWVAQHERDGGQRSDGRAPTSAWSCGGCGAKTSSCERSATF